MILRDILMKFNDTVRFRIVDYATDKIHYASSERVCLGQYSMVPDELLDASVETIDVVRYGFDAWVEFYIRRDGGKRI